MLIMLFPARFPLNTRHLTAREAQVLWLCAEGLVIQRIAEQLFVSTKTINRHCENIRLRFNLKGYHALRQFALKVKPELEKWRELSAIMDNITHQNG